MNVGISGVTNSGGIVQTQQAEVQDKTKLGKDDFMKLLIAQLKNQDPNQPTDAKELVTQLSQLSSVEQLTNMSTQLKNLQLAMGSMVNNEASSFVGKQIDANGSKLYLGDAGGASSGVSLTQPAETVTVSIRDDKGQVIRSMDVGKLPMGVSPVTWDGKTDSGEQAAAGTYNMTVEAKTKDGGPVDASAKISGIVERVSYERGFPELVVGKAYVALANVTSIKQ